jgi:hypothetical protein
MWGLLLKYGKILANSTKLVTAKQTTDEISNNYFGKAKRMDQTFRILKNCISHKGYSRAAFTPYMHALVYHVQGVSWQGVSFCANQTMKT